jgi:hypothetical protein
MRHRLLLPVLLLAVLSAQAEPPLRILFIGNSLTYTNDLPSMVRRIGETDGRIVDTQMIALPNYALEDHLGTPAVKAALAQAWDIIVLQQGPSSLDESGRQLFSDVKAFAALIRPHTRIAVLMVWPSRDYWRALPAVAESHRLAAAAVEGTLIPAGTNFGTALAGDAALELFGADGFHPSVIGTYLAALSTYRTLIGHLPRELITQRAARKVAPAMKATNAQLAILLSAAEGAAKR